MSVMNEVLACLSTAVCLLYWVRMVTLRWREHAPLVVAMNLLAGITAGYSAFVFWEYGVYPLPSFSTLLCALYFIRSRDSYERETRPAELDEIQVPLPTWPHAHK